MTDTTPHTPNTPTEKTFRKETSFAYTGVALFLAGCVIAALFAFVIYPRQSMIEANVDVNGYGALARFIARGEGFSQSCGPTLRRAPLYPCFVATLLRLFAPHADSQLPERLLYRPVFIAQCLMVGANCVAVWVLGRRLFNSRVGLLAALLCLVTPMVMRYVGSVEVETLTSLLITLMALTGYNLYRQPTIRNSVAFAVVCALATLTKSIVLLYPLLFLLVLWRVPRRDAHTTGESALPQVIPFKAVAACVLLVFGLCLLPWLIRNYRVSSGQFRNISSNGPGEFLRGYVNVQSKFVLLRQDFGGSDPTRLSWDQEANNYETALIRPYGLDYAAMERSAAPNPNLPQLSCIEYELRKEQVESAEMKQRILHHPVEFLRKFGMQLATFWYIVETRMKSLFVGALALLTLGVAFFGWLRARKSHPGVFVIAFTILYFNILYAVFLAFARYSMPLYPILLVLAAYGLTQISFRRKPHGEI